MWTLDYSEDSEEFLWVQRKVVPVTHTTCESPTTTLPPPTANPSYLYLGQAV